MSALAPGAAPGGGDTMGMPMNQTGPSLAIEGFDQELGFDESLL